MNARFVQLCHPGVKLGHDSITRAIAACCPNVT